MHGNNLEDKDIKLRVGRPNFVAFAAGCNKQHVRFVASVWKAWFERQITICGILPSLGCKTRCKKQQGSLGTCVDIGKGRENGKSSGWKRTGRAEEEAKRTARAGIGGVGEVVNRKYVFAF